MWTQRDVASGGKDLKIASWNVNSVRARLERVLAWLEVERPDVLCLQETKVVDEAFPIEPFEDAGYQGITHGQKTYNGVAILSRTTPQEICRGFDDGDDDLGARFLVAEIGTLWVASAYVPNGREVGTSHFRDKLAWFGRLRSLWPCAAIGMSRPTTGTFGTPRSAAERCTVTPTSVQPWSTCATGVSPTLFECTTMRPSGTPGGTIASWGSPKTTACAST